MFMVHIKQRSVSAPAASRDQGRMGLQTLVGAVVSERVGKRGWVLLRYFSFTAVDTLVSTANHRHPRE